MTSLSRLVSVVAVLLVGCTPPECLPDAPVKLGEVSGLRLKPELDSLTLISGTKPVVRDPLPAGYACPTFDFSELSGLSGGAQLSSTTPGGPRWDADLWYSDAQAGDGQCLCSPAVMKVEGSTPRDVSSDQFDVTLTQGTTHVRARYLNVSNSVEVKEQAVSNAMPGVRRYALLSGFSRAYFLLDPDRGVPLVTVSARSGATVALARSSVSDLSLTVTLEGTPDELIIETKGLFHNIQPSECVGATCDALRVSAPDQTLRVPLTP